MKNIHTAPLMFYRKKELEDLLSAKIADDLPAVDLPHIINSFQTSPFNINFFRFTYVRVEVFFPHEGAVSFFVLDSFKNEFINLLKTLNE